MLRGLTLSLPSRVGCVLAFTTLLARRLILLNWKNPRAPSLINWKRDLLSSIKLEKLRFSLRGSLAQFYAIWKPILMILELEFATIGNSQSNVS